VALLGAKITASQILGLGVMPIVTVVAGVVTTISLGFLASRLFGQSRTFGVLSGGRGGDLRRLGGPGDRLDPAETRRGERDTS
jgi:hypothetical protein